MQSLQDHDVPPVEYPYVSVFVSCSTSPSSHFVMSHSDGRLTTGLCHFPGGSEARAESDAFRYFPCSVTMIAVVRSKAC